MTTHITLIFYDINEDISNAFCRYSCISFDNQQNCINDIESRSKTETLFLITSLSGATDILPTVNSLRQLDSVFIYSIEKEDEKLLEKYSKIIGIFSQQTDLFQCIEENIDLTLKQIESFQFYEKYQKSTRDLTKESGSFLWLKLFKNVVLKLPHDEQAKQEMIEKLKEYYHNNTHQLKLIEKFNREYKSKDAIKWYTGQPFLYKQLNRALRTEDIELLYKFRYFISDLSKNLFNEYEILKDSFNSITFYRGVKLLKEEIKTLQENVGKLISMNGYLSTSFDKDLALRFADKSTDTETSVIFEIECDFDKINSVIMASIAHYSKHPVEEEVLFDLDAAFEILSIEKDSSIDGLIVKMKATDEGAEIAQEYIKYTNSKLNETNVAMMFGYLLAEIGQYDKSQQYFERLLKNSNKEDIPIIYYYLSVVKNYQGDYETALNYCQQAGDMLLKAQPSRELAYSYVLNDIGSILNSKGQYTKALDYHRRALNIRENYSDNVGISTSSANIGTIHRELGNYTDALYYLYKSLEIRQKYLPATHHDIATLFIKIGLTYSDMDDLDNALTCHQSSLEITEKCLPHEHENIAMSLKHIGNILTEQEKYDEGLYHYRRALNIEKNIFPNGHLNIAVCLNNIGFLYYKREDYTLALDYLKESFEMREKLSSKPKDSTFIELLTNFGLVYTALGEYKNALKYHEHALDVSRIIFPTGHFIITRSLNNIGIVYEEMFKYAEAIKYFEKSLENQEKKPTNVNWIVLIQTYDNMGFCLCKENDDQNGLEYRLKAIRMIEKVYPRLELICTVDAVGDACFAMGMYDKALECYFISLNIKLKCLPTNDIRIAKSLTNIGDVYIKKGNNNVQYKIKGRFYYEKALKIYKTNKHDNAIHILNRIGHILENMNKYHLTNQYYSEALETFENYFLSDDSVKKTCENNLARIKWLMK